MALVTQFICQECKQPRMEIVVPSRVCLKCRTAKSEAKEQAHMSFLVQLPIQERVRRIELALYRLNADERLKVLEAQNIKY